MTREEWQRVESELEAEQKAWREKWELERCGTCKHMAGPWKCIKFPNIKFANNRKICLPENEGCFSGWEPK